MSLPPPGDGAWTREGLQGYGLHVGPIWCDANGPLALRIEPAGTDQAVYVRVLAERAAPGVQGHQDAGPRTQVTRVLAQIEQALARNRTAAHSAERD